MPKMSTPTDTASSLLSRLATYLPSTVGDDLNNSREDVDESQRTSSEALPISKVTAETLNDADVRHVGIIIAAGVVIAAVSAIALGIAFAMGVKQVKRMGLVTSDCAPCADMGSDILKAGGSAVDATITTLLCNGLVNMHSSGIGGGGFMIIRDHKLGISFAVDFSPAAPLAAVPNKYKDEIQVLYGPMAVAVPGEVAGLAFAHKYYGKLPWKELVAPVAELARKGFNITKDVNYWMENRPLLKLKLREAGNEKMHSLLMSNITRSPKTEGTLIQRPDYAKALDLIAEDPNSFYTSDIAADIVNILNENITLDDLSNYKARTADVLRINYTDFTLETVGPPAGGAILFHMLKILEGYKFKANDSDSELMYHRTVEAMKFGLAAYPEIVDFVERESSQNFTTSLLMEGHCEEIRQRIMDNTTHDAPYYELKYDITPTQGTSAVTVIDADELFVSAVSSLNDYFGALVMTDKYGIILNNNLNNFDYSSFKRSHPSLPKNPDNEVKEGRRARSPMSPTVFYNQHRKCGQRGAVGGTDGIYSLSVMLQYILDVMSFGLTSEESIKRPRLQEDLAKGTLEYEDALPSDIKHQLQRRKHNLVPPHSYEPIGTISAGYKEATALDGKGDTRKQGKTTVVEV